MTKEEFLNGPEFMKIGKALQSENWSMAGACIAKLQKNAKEAGMTDFERPLSALRSCIVARQQLPAKNALASVIAKRVQYRNQKDFSEQNISEKNEEETENSNV